MIPYSLNTEIRKQVTVVLILISICVTAVFEYTLGKYFICIKNQSEFFNFISSLNSFKLLVEVTVPSFFLVVGNKAGLVYNKGSNRNNRFK